MLPTNTRTPQTGHTFCGESDAFEKLRVLAETPGIPPHFREVLDTKMNRIHFFQVKIEGLTMRLINGEEMIVDDNRRWSKPCESRRGEKLRVRT